MKRLACAAAALLAPAAPAFAAEFSAGAWFEYGDYSDGRGSRAVGEANATAKWVDSTLSFDLAHGRREFADEDYSGTQAEVNFYHDWSDRFYTRTTVALASDSPVFPLHQLRQEVNYKVTRDLVLQAAVGHNRYFGGVNAPNWSAGATYYFNGGFATYRYTGYDVEGLGNTHGHLATVRVNDDGGDDKNKGFTQGWVGTGTSLHEFDVLPAVGRGRVWGVAVRRLQPLGGRLALDISAARNWYDTTTGDYQGTTVRVGLVFNPL